MLSFQSVMNAFAALSERASNALRVAWPNSIIGPQTDESAKKGICKGCSPHRTSASSKLGISLRGIRDINVKRMYCTKGSTKSNGLQPIVMCKGVQQYSPSMVANGHVL